ncbi:aspartate carbamoyltransferase catalytic subunit [cyanobiont of Ornithocercus magnificus]|nr:aspartate carbamoyltransferase catalytic subunit [cyanobiont of Ornithocercus magnificus]
MSGWSHRHVFDLATFSREDYASVLELAHRFRALPISGARRLPALQGRLVTTLFFEASTRTRSSFELAARRLSAGVQSFTASNSSLSKGETILDTAYTYAAMGTDVFVVRHQSPGVPQQLAESLERVGKPAAVLNAGDGFHSHPSQGLLDLYTLAHYFNPRCPSPEVLRGRRILIVGDILHSRVARSNLWALTACGADVVLCGPPSLLPDAFTDFVEAPPPGQPYDPIPKRGHVYICRNLDTCLPEVDAVMTLRLQHERMARHCFSTAERYCRDYGLSHERLRFCRNGSIPVLHPGPVNRGVEMTGELLEDFSICLVREQVRNGVLIRMALLYLMAAIDSSTLV